MYLITQNEPSLVFPKQGILSDLQKQAYEKLIVMSNSVTEY